ncbi:M35 family metallo-endopeptidase [Stigmatella sp. ncwal1]|uniref:M35 family metallo-endopeptidase n=1 Tax=Stigmatella ashevillensis TaxID=2995309 RepID=A0ABT5DBB0_9BACT|nr:M35 family metallo-endopeptidase [Stigmatella ashevillena]MDC0709606.1 M35 family metallo-endopeptidase [Stigmatella ashevillena]
MGKSVGSRVHRLWGAWTSVCLLGACGTPQDTLDEAPPLSAPEAAPGEVSAHLSAPTSSFSAGDELTVSLSLTNVSSHPVRLLSWHTPAQGLTEDLLTVTLHGAPVEYTGPHYKRAAPQPGDFLTLAPGESLTRTVALSGLYDFSQSGHYAVSFSGSHHAASPALLNSFASNSLTLWIDGRPGPQDPPSTQAIAPMGLSYRQCSDSQKSDIAQAVNTAKSMAHRSVSYLSDTQPSNTPRYKTWFGSYTSTGWSTMKAHFSTLKTAFNSKPVVIDCTCTSNAYAYVYAHQPYTIYVCNAFWSAPMTGTDSKGGTLIHEMSHFTVVAGTDDHAYGQSAAKSLAISQPHKARDNADSHEYFAENTPVLR